MFSVSAIPALKDNYIWALRRDDRHEAVVVDPGDAQPVLHWLDTQGLTLGAILVTHHHWDHTQGIHGLRQRWPVPVYGPAHERQPITALSHPLEEGQRVRVDCLQADFEVIAIPGHTLGHIALHGEGALFCGDTLFSAGCGRLFEGTAEMMHRSLQRLACLPEHTRVYCGHEYTEANLVFALTVEPGNADAHTHLAEVRRVRAHAQPSLPSTIGREHRINPFLRCALPAVAQAASRHAGRTLSGDIEVFAALRAWKDQFNLASAAV
ncbi:MAG TPA: hydroxyacylglutathione hydrolase [Nevskiales bacterium]|nr:hydroxyacylglutathione hydrolase [Nevskiales bacterium]